MKFDKPVERGNDQAVPSEAFVRPDDRLARLQVALSDVAQMQEMVNSTTDATELSICVDERAGRLEAALEIISNNLSGLEQTTVEGIGNDELEPGAILDDNQTALVLKNIELAAYFARRYTKKGEPFDDLFQVASFGLMKAALRFKPELGYAFSSFAAATIKGEIKRHFRDKTWFVGVPRQAKEIGVHILDAQSELAQKHKRNPTTAEIAEHLKVDIHAVYVAIQARQAYKSASLDELTSFNPNARTIGDTVGDDEDGYRRVENKALAEELLAQLEFREALILRARAGMTPFTTEHSQSKIAAILGISQMQVSRLELRALEQLSSLVNEADVVS